MSTVRKLRAHSPTALDDDRRDAALAVLDEIVGQLAERVELLEIRERIARTRVSSGPGRLGRSA